MTASASTIPLRAALYPRVSTARQGEHDVSIPDQRRQDEAYCLSRGYGLVEAGPTAIGASMWMSVSIRGDQTWWPRRSSQTMA